MFKRSIQQVFGTVLPWMRGSGNTSVHSSKHSKGEQSASDEKHPKLAIGYGRSDTRGYIKSFTRRLQTSIQESSRMARVLSTTTRIEETEGIRERAEKRVRSAVEITRLIAQPGFKHYQSLFDRIEVDAYFSLRDPNLRKDGMSAEYYIAYNAGMLAVVEEFKNVADLAKGEVEKAKKKQDDEQ